MASIYIEQWLDGPAGHSFYTRTYPAPSPRAVVIFVHGFADHISRYEDAHSHFAEHGITVFAYDLRGFGRTALDKQRRSEDECYGKTSRLLELNDLQWWVNYVSREYPQKPIFLLGYSAGGGLTLAFATRSGPPPKPEAITLVSGIIAQAPLVHLRYPVPKVLRHIVHALGNVLPWWPIPASLPLERFSRDPHVVQSLQVDPLRRAHGTARGLHDMITQGEELLDTDFEHWPNDLPLLMTWGTADEVCHDSFRAPSALITRLQQANCPKAGVAFFDKVIAKDKRLVLYDGAVHDLLHEADGIPAKVIDEYCTWIEAHLDVRRCGSSVDG
ncbi:lysophospholipase [Trametes cingulata]|nr:lysophospholipase [Trametes cingulata]